MTRPIFTTLLTLFIAACDNGLSVDMAARPKNESSSSNSASSVSVDPVKQSATPHTSVDATDRKYGTRSNGSKNRTYHFFG